MSAAPESVNRSDYLSYNQFPARDLTVPKFGRTQTVTGGVSKVVRSIAWSCDGKKVATGTEFMGLRIWDCKSTMDAASSSSLPSSSSRPSPHNGHVTALAFSPVDPDVLVSGCRSASSGGSVAVWNLKTPKEAVATFKVNGDVIHMAFHPSGRQFAAVCPRSRRDEVLFFHLVESGGKEVWAKREDVDIGGLPVGAEAPFDEVNSLRFTNSGKMVCAVSNDGSLNGWVYPTQPRPFVMPAHLAQDPISTAEEAAPPEETTADDDVDMSESKDATDVVSDSKDEDTPVKNTQESLKIDTAPPSRIPTPPHVDADKAREKELLDERRRQKQLIKLRHSVCHSASLLALAFDPLGRFLAVGGQEALLSLFDTRNWICQRTFDVCQGAIRHIDFSPDGELIAIGGDDNFIAIVGLGIHLGDCGSDTSDGDGQLASLAPCAQLAVVEYIFEKHNTGVVHRAAGVEAPSPQLLANVRDGGLR